MTPTPSIPSRAPAVLACVLVAAGVACGSPGPTNESFGGGTAADTILMSPTTQPTYGWNKGNADTIDVARLSDPATPVWRTIADSADGITSGVTHGTTGLARSVTVNTEPVLSVGVSYRVRIVRQTGPSVITKDFTVQP